MRDGFLDFARGLVMLLVVFGHCLQVACGGCPDDAVQLVIRMFQMPALFLLSGYIEARSSQWSKTILEILKSRSIRLLVPTVVWVWLWYFVRVFAGFEAYSLFGQFERLLTSGFWFLRELFVIMLLHSLLANGLFRGFKMLSSVVLFAAGVAGYALSGFKIEFGFSSISYYLTFFEIGYLFRFLNVIGALQRFFRLKYIPALVLIGGGGGGAVSRCCLLACRLVILCVGWQRSLAVSLFLLLRMNCTET